MKNTYAQSYGSYRPISGLMASAQPINNIFRQGANYPVKPFSISPLANIQSTKRPIQPQPEDKYVSRLRLDQPINNIFRQGANYPVKPFSISPLANIQSTKRPIQPQPEDSASIIKQHSYNPLNKSQRSNSLLSSDSTCASSSQNVKRNQDFYQSTSKLAERCIQEINNVFDPRNKIRAAFYLAGCFNNDPSIIRGNRASDEVRFNSSHNLSSALLAQYNRNFTEMYPVGNTTFFHQKQTGPYCQTVAINNFLGDLLVTPETLNKMLKLNSDNIDVIPVGILETLETFAKLRDQQVDYIHNFMKNKENSTITTTQKKSIEEANILIKQLDCRASFINQKNKSTQIARIINAAHKSKVDRMHLVFFTDPKYHAIAIRKDENDPNLWVVLDGNYNPYRQTLKNILTNYTQLGEMGFIANKALFEQDSKIARYEIEQDYNGNNHLIEPTISQLANWSGRSEQQIIECSQTDNSYVSGYFIPIWKDRQKNLSNYHY